jgi:vacuolar-type H+-ATPase subunit I/STV1
MEAFGKISMEKLSEKAEIIWKVLTHHSDGATAKRLQQITSMRKTVVYEALKELESKRFIVHEKRLWKLREKPSTEKPSKLSILAYKKWNREYADQRLDEDIRELQAEIDADREVSHLQDPELTLALDKEGKVRFVEAINEQTYTPEKKAIIRRKWRKYYGLDTELPDKL